MIVPNNHDLSSNAPDAGAPVLDYQSPPPPAPAAGPLVFVVTIELVVLLFASVILDGGMLLRTISAGFLVYWPLKAVTMRRCRQKPSISDRLSFLCGVTVSAGGIVITL